MTDTSNLTQLVSALRAETESASISPENMGYILQCIVDFLPNLDNSDMAGDIAQAKANAAMALTRAAEALTSANNATAVAAGAQNVANAANATAEQSKTAAQAATAAVESLTALIQALQAASGEATEIVDGLDSEDAGKVLSANQGRVLKCMIDNIEATIDSEDTGLAEVALNIKFSLTQNLTDLTSSVDADIVGFGDALTVTLTAESGYTIGTCRVTMGGADITNTAYSNNVVYIAEVTGDVVIKAVAAEAGNIPVQFADTAVEAIILANTTHTNPSYITEEEALLVTQIGSDYPQGSWFKGNTQITSFDELGKFGVTSLYEGAFNGCSALVSIDISKISALTTRDSFGSTFMGCTSLVKIKTSNTLTTIPPDCFRDCIGLRVVDLGESVTTLKDMALSNTSNDLKTIVMRSTTPPNYEYTWKKRGGKLYVPDEAFDAYQATDWGTNYPAVADSYGTQMLKLSDYVEE